MLNVEFKPEVDKNHFFFVKLNGFVLNVRQTCKRKNIQSYS